MIYAIIAIVIIFVIIISIFFVKSLSSPKSYGRRAVSPKSYGNQGERRVSKILGDTIEGQQYVINDLLFEDKSGNTHQIDHIYINHSGIWVIETKNWAGKICGDENWHNWTQTYDYKNEKKEHYNPVKQNYTHIYRLSEVLDVKGIFLNVVVFLERADIRNVNSQCVYSIYELESIKNSDSGIILSEEEMHDYYEKLLVLKNSRQINEKEHIRNIQYKRNQIEQGFCPRCGAKLVLRNGKNGQFYGCSNYPKCTFTKNID